MCTMISSENVNIKTGTTLADVSGHNITQQKY